VDCADTAGTHQFVVEDASGEIVQRLAIFVLEPSANINAKGSLNGYRIGTYPKDTPEGFIRYTAADKGVRIFPDFTLDQFLNNQQPGAEIKYLLLPTFISTLHRGMAR